MKHSGRERSLAAIMTKGICLGLLALCFSLNQGCATDKGAQLSNQVLPPSTPESGKVSSAVDTKPEEAVHPKRADFGSEPKSRDAREVADWVIDSGDNQGMPFAILDKVDAKVFVFHRDGRLRGAAPALLGLAKGDDDIPGIGNQKLSNIRANEKITPAGRFVSALGKNFNGESVLWVDYDDAVALHPVVTSNPKEHRLERLESPTPLDNRISFGCINVPKAFFFDVVSPAFTGTNGIVYVLPEVKSKYDTFTSYYDVDLHWATDTSANPDKATKVVHRQLKTTEP